MCAGCPGGQVVSTVTAYLNRYGLKRAALAELQRIVGTRAQLSLFGDRWVLTGRTGQRDIVDDLHQLTEVLVARKLVDPPPSPQGQPPATPPVPVLDLVQHDLAHGPAATQDAEPSAADAPVAAKELVAGLLFRPAS